MTTSYLNKKINIASKKYNTPETRLMDFSLVVGLASLFSLFLPWAHKKIPLYSSLINVFYIFDLIQVFSVIVLCIIVIRTMQKSSTIIRSVRNSKEIILVISLILILAVEMWYGNNFAVMAFARKNFQTDIHETTITAFFKQKVENGLENTSTPSGFVFRQWIILLLALYILNLNNIKKSIKIIKIYKIQFAPLRVFFYFSFVYVCLARVIRQAHTITDIATAVCLGNIVFFLIIFANFAIFKEKIQKTIVDSYIGFSIGSFIVFLVISEKPIFWIYTIFGFAAIIILIYKFCEFDKGGKTWN